jgi:membrane fusion protein (multidrug efflux system)
MNDSTTNNAAARRRGLTVIAAAVVVAGAGWGIWHWMVGRHLQDTDNAYVSGNVVQITPLVGGTVVAVQANETDFVKAGQPLVKLDPADARVALDQAEAQLAQTVRETRGLYATAALQAQLALREADLSRAQAELSRAKDDVARRSALVSTGAVGKEEFQHASVQLVAARNAESAAESAVQAAREQLAASQAMVDGTSVADHPAVQRAAKVREAYLALQRVTLLAPADGQVAKRNVQLGQRCRPARR